jgi:hypothetical protein
LLCDETLPLASQAHCFRWWKRIGKKRVLHFRRCCGWSKSGTPWDVAPLRPLVMPVNRLVACCARDDDQRESSGEKQRVRHSQTRGAGARAAEFLIRR